MTDSPKTSILPVQQAMDRVLAAERDVQRRLEAVREEADRILAAARGRARAIDETAQQRIARLHAEAHEQTAEEIRDMRREHFRRRAAMEAQPAHRELTRGAAEAVARRLTSPGDD